MRGKMVVIKKDLLSLSSSEKQNYCLYEYDKKHQKITMDFVITQLTVEGKYTENIGFNSYTHHSSVGLQSSCTCQDASNLDLICELSTTRIYDMKLAHSKQIIRWVVMLQERLYNRLWSGTIEICRPVNYYLLNHDGINRILCVSWHQENVKLLKLYLIILNPLNSKLRKIRKRV